MQTFAPHHKGGAHHVWTYGSACFKVFTIVTDSIDIDNRKLSLYTFSSTEPRWSKPRRCFHKRGFTLLCQDAAVSHGVAHWFVSYHNEQEYVVKRYTYNVNAETGHQSLTDLSIPAGQFKMRGFVGRSASMCDLQYRDGIHWMRACASSKRPMRYVRATTWCGGSSRYFHPKQKSLRLC
jgi:hypothetical protein